MGVHHALGPTGGAARVVDRDDLILIFDRPVEVVGRAGRQECLVIRTLEVESGIDVVHCDDSLQCRQIRQSRFHEWRQLAVDDQCFCAGVGEDVGDLVGLEPGVDRDHDPARERYAEMRLEHLRDVWQEDRHPVAPLDAGLAQRRGEPVDPRVQLGIGDPLVAMDNRDLLAEDCRRALQEAERSQVRLVNLRRVHGWNPEADRS